MLLDEETGNWFDQNTKIIISANTQIRCSVRIHAVLEPVLQNQEPSLSIRITLNEQSQKLTATLDGYIYKIEDAEDSKNVKIFADKLRLYSQLKKSTKGARYMMSNLIVHTLANEFLIERLAIGASYMVERAMEACMELKMDMEVDVMTSSLVHADGDVGAMARILTKPVELDGEMGLGAVPESRSSIASKSDGSKCVICQDEFFGGMGILRVPCSHIFHGQCIIRWLEESHVCPVCLFEMTLQNIQGR